MKRSNETFRRWSISLKRPALRVARSSGRHALALRGLNHLQAVLVGAGEEKHVLAVEPLKARQRIGRDRLIGVTDMRHAVRIGDRGGDVIGVACRRARWHRGCAGRVRRFGGRAFRFRARRVAASRRGLAGAVFFADFSAGFLAELFCSFFRRRRFLCRFLHRLLGGFPHRLGGILFGLLRDALALPGALFRAVAFAARDALRRATFFAVLFSGSFFLARRHHNFLHRSNGIVGNHLGGARSTAWLPQAGQTPRKPAVFVPDCRIRCRARRG